MSGQSQGTSKEQVISESIPSIFLQFSHGTTYYFVSKSLSCGLSCAQTGCKRCTAKQVFITYANNANGVATLTFRWLPSSQVQIVHSLRLTLCDLCEENLQQKPATCYISSFIGQDFQGRGACDTVLLYENEPWFVDIMTNN